MSAFGKHGVRCDKCGKIANNRSGEYLRKDMTCGYIMPEDNENGGSQDICTDCIDAEQDIKVEDVDN
jgi:hypothetical protein